jgi:hypothetical protein
MMMMVTTGYGPNYTYNPYGNPYPGGIPGGGFMQQPYGYGGGYGGGFGMPFGNPYGGYNTFPGAQPGTSYNVGFGGGVPGYGFQTAAAPTVFQTPVSGNGQLSILNGARPAQDSYALQQGNNWAKQGSVVGAGIGAVLSTGLLITGAAILNNLGPVGKGINRMVGAKGALLLTGLGTITGGLVGNMHGEKLGQTWGSQTYVGLEYADNGHAEDGSYYRQRNGQFM